MSARWSTGRLEAFSDGIFAIAITLLVLDIAIDKSELHDFWGAVGNQWPAYLGYATSFLAIGGLWLIHDTIFRRLEVADATVTRINLILLMLVAFLPFPTSLLADAIHQTHAERGAVVFYGLNLLAISFAISILWRHIASHRELLKPEVSDAEVHRISTETTPNTGFYAAVVLIGLAFPRGSAFAYLVIALVSVLRSGGDRLEMASETQPGED